VRQRLLGPLLLLGLLLLLALLYLLLLDLLLMLGLLLGLLLHVRMPTGQAQRTQRREEHYARPQHRGVRRLPNTWIVVFVWLQQGAVPVEYSTDSRQSLT